MGAGGWLGLRGAWFAFAQSWDGESGEALAVMAGHDGPITATALHLDRDGQDRIITGGDDCTVRVGEWVGSTRRLDS
jgi:WD40 repeat protein